MLAVSEKASPPSKSGVRFDALHFRMKRVAADM